MSVAAAARPQPYQDAMRSMFSKKPPLAAESAEPAASSAAEEARAGVPVHVGVIMDGNGRWAQSRGLPRIEGHRRGLDALRATVRAAIDFGLEYLTVYSFSVENWSRPADEISDLLGLLKFFVRHDLADLRKANVRIRIIGGRDDLAQDLRDLLVEAEERTRDCSGLTLIVAFNYGARQEIAAAAKALAQDAVAGRLDPDRIDDVLFASRLDTAGAPDPDLIIRTSGEQRLSNFLMWQAAYAELIFLPMCWPDFDRKAFAAALAEYGQRERRFGGAAPVGKAAAAGT